MIIDFHTHIFPDKIAAATISALEKNGGTAAYANGTESGLVSALTLADAELGINLPALTKPTQFDSVRLFAKEINKKEYSGSKIISFAGMHPGIPNIEECMELIKSDGFLGIKIHPDYQGTFFDDGRYVRIVESAKRLGLIVVTHAGVDGAFRDTEVRCTPVRVLRLLDKIGGYSKLVLAHLGGNEMTSEIYNMLAGEDVYFDTAYVLPRVTKSEFSSMLEKHGEDRILFASDSPWSDIKRDAEIIRSFSLGKEAEKKIFSENAKKLLGIN